MSAHFVYRCYSDDGRLLYVGQTKDWTQRREQHRHVSFWACEVARVKVRAHRSPEVARAAEKRAIQTEHPRFNYQGRWAVRSIWPSKSDWVDYVRAATAKPTGSSVARAHIEKVFASYAVVFGETHPLADALRSEWDERARRQAIEAEAREARHAEERRRQDAEDRRAMFAHFARCAACAEAGDWSPTCPDVLADLAREAVGVA